jgi:ABC-type multidrug transport system fused ATPase/permease subunit
VQYGTAFVFLFIVALIAASSIVLRNQTAQAATMVTSSHVRSDLFASMDSADEVPPFRQFNARPARWQVDRAAATLIEIENSDFYYGATQALHDINLKLPTGR